MLFILCIYLILAVLIQLNIPLQSNPTIYVQALKITQIPSTGTPPQLNYALTSIFDDQENRIISFGGYILEEKSYTYALNIFNLTENLWDRILPESSLVPPGLGSAQLYLRKDRTLLVFFGEKADGISGDVFSFNLNTRIWNTERLIGDPISGRRFYGFERFVFEGKNYVGIFGGITYLGSCNDLFLIDTDSLEVKEMPKVGQVPDTKVGPSLSFFNNSLYAFGYTSGYEETPSEKNLYRYDLIYKYWEIVSTSEPKPEMRNFLSSIVFNDSLYIIYGSCKEKNIFFSSIWKYTFSSSSWSLFSNFKDEFLTQFGQAQSGSKLYFISGRNLVDIYNSISYIDFSKSPHKRKTLAINWEGPSARKNFCSKIINDKIWIFGGVSDKGAYLNDIWEYYITNNYWKRVITQGKEPKSRELTSCILVIGGGVVIYGGRDSTTIFNDFSYYDSNNKYWITLNDGTDFLSGRYGACFIPYLFSMLIIGGADFGGTISQILIYNYVMNTIYTVIEKNNIKLAIMDHYCWSETDDNGDVMIFAAGGRSFENNGNSNVYLIRISFEGNNYYSETSIFYSDNSLMPAESSAVAVGDEIIVSFGTFLDYALSKDIIAYNWKNNTVRNLGSFSDIFTFGHGMLHYGKSFYIFGGGIHFGSLKVHSFATAKLFRIDSDEDGYQITCSSGTISPNCDPCPPGYYCEENTPEPCPPGSSSLKISCTHASQCIPCDYGYFSSKSASTLCLECFIGSFCPLGSSFPKDKFVQLTFFQSQPSDYPGNTTFVEKTVNYLWMLIGIISFIATIIIFLGRNFLGWIKNIDIFTDAHEQDLDVPVIYKKNEIGGIFTLYFILGVFVTIFGLFLSFYYDNISEIKSLVPVATLTKNIKADNLAISVTFFEYNGPCVEDNECHENISIDDESFKFTKKIQNCYKDEGNCMIKVEYEDFESENESSVTFKINENIAYSNGIMVTMTCTSSIPENGSSINIPIYPDSTQYVFKGSTPSIFYIELIPSIFTSQSSKWPSFSTGYHLTLLKPTELGSQVSQQTINLKAFIFVKVIMKISNNALITQRNTVSSWFIFLSGLFGSVFGFMETISFLMGLVEGFSENWVKYKFNRLKIHRIKQFRKGYKQLYKHTLKSINQNKVLPESHKINLNDKKDTSNLSMLDNSVLFSI
ncbi:hypothetical protein SteCoe_23243 [Stentor coeruleus]|uniref:Tyrosine-protein kinase ephrin type A/B receptor-like domain-containing protein n=1 Tax=Stentor coeruleus TaxID=5963 RepID=A0A1R2BKC7_9CILI|nr:hypothetical protein SteCoe_23243 [Stentor coeruleus]